MRLLDDLCFTAWPAAENYETADAGILSPEWAKRISRASGQEMRLIA
jgi:hypothetical protein